MQVFCLSFVFHYCDPYTQIKIYVSLKIHITHSSVFNKQITRTQEKECHNRHMVKLMTEMSLINAMKLLTSLKVHCIKKEELTT